MDMSYLPPLAALMKKLSISRDQLDGGGHVILPAPVLKALLQLAAPNSDFDERDYLDRNPDVRAAIEAGRIANAHSHFATVGYFEDRRGGVPVDESWYLRSYPDVRSAVDGGAVKSATDHFYAVGAVEGRSPSRRALTEARKWKEALSA
jgi:hypothetical protein